MPERSLHRYIQKAQQFKRQLKYLPPTFHLIWQACKWWTVAWIALLIVQGVLPAFSIYTTRLLVNLVVEAVETPPSAQTVYPIIYWALILGFILLLMQVIQSVLAWIRVAQSELVSDYLTERIHQKAAEIDMAFYESPQYHDQLYRTTSELKNRPLALLESGGSLFQNAITLLSIGALIIPYGAWLPVMLLISALPAFYIVLRFNRIYYRWWKSTTGDQRWAQYYDSVLTLNTTAAELRVFGLAPHFQKAYKEIRHRLRHKRLTLLRQQSVAQLSAGAFGTVVTGVAMGWVIWRTISGYATVGDITLFYQVFNRGQSALRAFLNSIGQIYNNTLFLENLFEYFEQTPQIRDPELPTPAPTAPQISVRFNDITFRYPGSATPVLQHFHLHIPAGKIVAIVGENGAGKTTLIKLLSRFYDPEEGSVELDGIDIRQFRLAELREMTTTMFQSPTPYINTVADNIKLGALAADPQPPEIQRAATYAGAHDFIMELPDQYETLLGKLFPSGVELSGGQWQRLALARAFLREAPIIVLDEPTSALDSWSEADWFERFRSLAAGRTAIVITHRFTIAKDADLIHVMEQGKIIESGTHEELLRLDGRYAHSWRVQTESIQPPSAVAENGVQPPIAVGDTVHANGA